MSKEILIGMGANLGFIEKIVLTDGTVIENTHVLYRSPIPNKNQFNIIFDVANEVSRHLVGRASEQWSAYPETMVGNHIFKERCM